MIDKNFTMNIVKFAKANSKALTLLFEKFDLTTFEGKYLLIFEDENDLLTMKEITELMDTDKSNTTRAVSRLIRKGLLKKSSPNNKKRGFNLKLTKRGNEINLEINEEFQNYHRRLIALLDNKEEEKMFLDLLNKLFNKMEDVKYII